MNFNNLCRTCMKENCEMQSIFEQRNDISLALMIKACTMTTVSDDDELPKYMCLKCIENISVAYEFKRTCENAFKSLKSIIVDSKMNVIMDDDDDNTTAYNTGEIEEINIQFEPQESDNSSSYSFDYQKNDSYTKPPAPLLTVKLLPNEKFTQTEEVSFFPCEMCDSKFLREDLLKEHRQIHGEKDHYRCRFCGKVYTRLIHLRHHISAKHPGVFASLPVIKCDKCNKHFTRNQHYQRHLMKVHNIEIELTTVCGKNNQSVEDSSDDCEDTGSENGNKDDDDVDDVDDEDEYGNDDGGGNVGKNVATNVISSGVVECNINDTNTKAEQKLVIEQNDNSVIRNDYDGEISNRQNSSSVKLENDTTTLIDIPLMHSIFDTEKTNDDNSSTIKVDTNKDKNDNNNVVGDITFDFNTTVDSKSHIKPLKISSGKRKQTEERENFKLNTKVNDMDCSNATNAGAAVDAVEQKPNKILDNNELGELTTDKKECKICFKITETVDEFDEHNKWHSDNVNTCPHCLKKYRHLTHLKRHVLTHIKEKPFFCDICQRRFNRAEQLELHTYNHTEAKPYNCDECPKGYARLEHLKRHKLNHSKSGGDGGGGGDGGSGGGGGGAEGGADDMKVDNDNNAEVTQKSMKTAGKTTEYCSICNRGFRTQNYLHIHMKCHTDRVYRCRLCKEKFDKKSALTEHNTLIHANERPFLCSECGLRFVRNDYLVIHMRRHKGEKPYKCKYCAKGFPRATDLTVHERYHTGEKTHLCTICGKGFQRAYNLLVHTRVHTGERPYQCPHCVKSFAQGNDLKAHIRRHTGERYKCELCGEGFIQGYHLTQHKRSVHGIDVRSHIRRVEKFLPATGAGKGDNEQQLVPILEPKMNVRKTNVNKEISNINSNKKNKRRTNKIIADALANANIKSNSSIDDDKSSIYSTSRINSEHAEYVDHVDNDVIDTKIGIDMDEQQVVTSGEQVYQDQYQVIKEEPQQQQQTHHLQQFSNFNLQHPLQSSTLSSSSAAITAPTSLVPTESQHASGVTVATTTTTTTHIYNQNSKILTISYLTAMPSTTPTKIKLSQLTSFPYTK